MRVRIQCNFALLLAFAVVSTALAAAQTAQTKPSGDKPLRAELALDYSYIHSNAPPGGCACFNLNGGSASFAWSLKPASQFAVVGDLTAAHSSGISSAGYDLLLSTYTVGARYRPRLGHSPLQPFGQVLVGAAHTSGSLVSGQTAANASAAFAANLGGGLDLRANRRFSFRLIEADYLVTTIDNGGNNHQNNLRLGAGVVLRFGKS
jgi:outer membrane immunogenic protein